MKTFEQLLDELVLATSEVDHERQSTLRDKHPEYLRAAKRDFDLSYRMLLAYNKKHHK